MHLFSSRINLASASLGAKAESCSNDFFADKSRLIQDAAAKFIDEKYDDHGKWMDGWETKRRRSGGYDWCIIKLATKGRIKELEIDTSHFTGNFPPAAQVEAAAGEKCPQHHSDDWLAITELVELEGDSSVSIACSDSNTEFNWVRLCIYPDGGVARLRVYGEPALAHNLNERIELSSCLHGGRVVAVSNTHYGNTENVLMPTRGANMGDGWETARRRVPGNEWMIIKLAKPGLIDAITIDTNYFKGNFPESVSVQADLIPALSTNALITQAMFWHEVLARQSLKANSEHSFNLVAPTNASHVKINSFPDGGISRIRVFGTPLSNC